MIGFLPVLVAAGWVLLAGQPDANWFQRHTTSWSNDIAIDGLVDDLRTYLGVLAFGLGSSSGSPSTRRAAAAPELRPTRPRSPAPAPDRPRPAPGQAAPGAETAGS